jgi:hypothetical protein
MENNKNNNDDECDKINKVLLMNISEQSIDSVWFLQYICVVIELQGPVSCTFPLVCLPFHQERQ